LSCFQSWWEELRYTRGHDENDDDDDGGGGVNEDGGDGCNEENDESNGY
jgi:hypothetical protein